MSFDTILAKSPSIIYRPGVASSKLAVETWAEVQAFIALRTGAVIVFVDDSVTSPAPVPGASGITDCGGRVEIRSALTDSLGTSVLVIQDGATLRDLSIIRGVEVQCDTRGATPALDFTSVDGGNLLLKDFSTLSNANTATQPAITIANGKTLFVNMEEGALIHNAPAVPIFSVALGGTLQMWALNATSLSGANPGFAAGAGNVELNYDNSSASFFGAAGVPIPPPLPGLTGVYTTTNTDNVWQSKPIDKATFDAPADFNVPVFHAAPGAGQWKAQALSTSMTFLASTNDVLAAAQAAGTLPTTGIVPITISGCGGGGGGGGGQGGGAGNGAGAGGGALFHEVTFDFDLSHRLDIVIGNGGTPGNGGAAGSNSGTRGGDGQPTYALDFTSNTVLGSLHAGAGGGPNQATGGRGGASYPGEALYAAPSPNPALIPQHSGGLPFSSGFPASGGQAAAGAGVPGFQGQFGLNSIGVPAGVTMWAGGAGGGAGAGAGAAGGGGGPGPFGNGGAGGTPSAAGPTGAGASPGANTGGGGGGGAGGNTAGDAGGNGGTGGSGRARIRVNLI